MSTASLQFVVLLIIIDLRETVSVGNGVMRESNQAVGAPTGELLS